MSENKHTPGPWGTDEIAVRSEGPNGRQIALCEISVRGRPYDETYDEALANARLIASAPDLLAEVERLRASNAELVAALRPFAAIKPSALFANDEQCGYRVIIEAVGTAEFTNADLACARTAIARAEGGEG